MPIATTNNLPILSLALVDWRTSSALVVSDLSTYQVIPTSQNVAMQITPPGYPTINVPFTPGNVNVYHCADLGITCGDEDCCRLPDGIYSIIYKVKSVSGNPPRPVVKEIDCKFIRVDNIRCKFKHAFVKVDIACDCSSDEQRVYLAKLKRIKLYIDGSVAEANNGNYALSAKYYNKADEMLNDIMCKFPKFNYQPCGC